MEKQGRETIPITPSLRLVPYYPAYETTLPWYQDAELCHQVDNQNRIYDLSILKNMYEYLNTLATCFTSSAKEPCAAMFVYRPAEKLPL